MILQTLLSIAIVAVIAGAILTSALANAKVAAHQAATRLATAALARGTDEFVNWAQRYVAKHGAATTWPTTAVVDQPVGACGVSKVCSEFVTVAYRISSSTTDGSGPDGAMNLQRAVDEQRLSGQINAQITGSDGTPASNVSELVTLRILAAPPFAVLTGIREIASLAGPTNAHEGDTGGYRQVAFGETPATPNPLVPSAEKNTTVGVSMTCQNSLSNDNSKSPFANSNAPGNDSLPWGNHGSAAFEAPCTPSYLFSAYPPIPSDASINSGNVYDVGSLSDSSWKTFSSSATWAL